MPCARQEFTPVLALWPSINKFKILKNFSIYIAPIYTHTYIYILACNNKQGGGFLFFLFGVRVYFVYVLRAYSWRAWGGTTWSVRLSRGLLCLQCKCLTCRNIALVTINFLKERFATHRTTNTALCYCKVIRVQVNAIRFYHLIFTKIINTYRWSFDNR